jgi:hypothetical protein
MSQLVTWSPLKKTDDDPYFQTRSLNSVGVPCTVSTSSLVDPTVKYPLVPPTGCEGSIRTLSGEPGHMSQLVTWSPLKKTDDDPYFQTRSLNSVGVPCTVSTSSLEEPTVKLSGGTRLDCSGEMSFGTGMTAGGAVGWTCPAVVERLAPPVDLLRVPNSGDTV